MSALTTAITPVIVGIKGFVEAHPQVTAAIIGVTIVVVGLTIALVALGLALGPIAAAFTAVGAVIAFIGAPILIVIAAVVALGIAFATNFMGIRTKTEEVF